MDTTSRTLYIENFPLDTKKEALERLFGQFGKIKHIELPTFDANHPLNKTNQSGGELKSKGYAFIEFQNLIDTDKACKFFNDLNYILASEKEFDGTIIQQNDGKQVSDNVLNDNNQFKLLRVMKKKTFRELSRRYDEQKFQSLMKAAKRLVIA